MSIDIRQFGRQGNFFGQLKAAFEAKVGPYVTTGAPTNGTSGTFANYAGPGALLVDTTNGVYYLNTGTLASPVWTKVMGSSVTQEAEVSLTNAQVLALRATPITLVAAPGAGKVNQFVSGLLLFDRTAVYTETADNLAIKYVDGSGTKVSVDIETTGFLDAAADAMYFVEPIAGTLLGVKTLFENAPLVLHNIGDGEFGGGNAANVLRAKINYRVWSTGF